MWSKAKSIIKYVGMAILTIAILVFLFRAHQGRVKAEKERDELMAIVLMQEDTIELRDGLYAKKVAELNEVVAALDSSKADIAKLKEEIQKRGQELAYYSELSITWKDKYEGAAEAYQELLENWPEDVPLPRIRVNFEKDFGPFRVDGHTVTSPPEAFVSVSQTRPLRIGIALTQDDDGKWNTVVSSSEDGFEVDVNVSAKDKQFELIDWRDRLTTTLDVGFLGQPSLGVGIMYGDKWAVGPRCSAYAGDSVEWSCGVGLSWRPFDR